MRPTLFFALFLSTSLGWAQGVRSVDFANRVWPHTCAGPIRTRRGASRERVPGLGVEHFRVDAPVFGDLDGDGRDEAIVRTHCIGDGRNRFGDATVFAWRGGQLREVGYLGLGVVTRRLADDERDTLESVRVERGVIVEERPADQRGGPEARYVVTHRWALRGGRLVESAPASVACRPAHAEGCVPPSELSPEVRFLPGHMADTRPLTFDANGNLPTLALRVLEGQDLSVDLWCDGTEPALVRIEPPAGPAVESDSTLGYLHARAERSGRYRVLLRARRAVGLCYARLGVHVLASSP